MKKKSTRVLALDTSSTITGWCLFVNGKYFESGTIDLHKQKDSDLRVKAMCLKIMKLMDGLQPTEVVVEELTSMRNVRTVRILTRIIGSAYNSCLVRNVSYAEIPCSTWRNIVNIKNKRRKIVKELSIARASDLYKKYIDDNEADAINLCDAYCILKKYRKRSKGEKVYEN